MELRADPQCQALHCQQVLRLRDHDAKVIELQEPAELALFAYEALHAIVEPVGRYARALRHPDGCLAHLTRRAKQPIHVLGGWPRSVRQAHDGTTHQEQFAVGTGLAQFLIQQSEEPAQVSIGKGRHFRLARRYWHR